MAFTGQIGNPDAQFGNFVFGYIPSGIPPWVIDLYYSGHGGEGPSDPDEIARIASGTTAWELGQALGNLYDYDPGQASLVEKQIRYELGDEYGHEVTFADFEGKIVGSQDMRDGAAEIVKIAEAFEREHEAQMRLVKKAVLVAGSAYVIWKFLAWL